MTSQRACKEQKERHEKIKWVFTWRRASPLGRASPLCRDPASQLNSLSKFVFVYMRGGPALLGEISLLTTGPPRRASKSKLRTHDKGCLDQHFLDNFSFHKLCLCVGYKMKTCTQISDSGFRRKINVVSQGDSAKRANPSRRAGFSHVNAGWNPALLVGLAIPKRAGPPPCKHHLRPFVSSL